MNLKQSELSRKDSTYGGSPSVPSLRGRLPYPAKVFYFQIQSGFLGKT